jgi:hypothetical protein
MMTIKKHSSVYETKQAQRSNSKLLFLFESQIRGPERDDLKIPPRAAEEFPGDRFFTAFA